MISAIYLVCATTAAACATAHASDCVSKHTCEERFIPLTLTEVPTPQRCFMIAQTELSKVWGEKDWAGLRLVGLKCGDVVNFERPQQDASLPARRAG